eukprot:tig00020830_g14503.t1
MSEADRAAHKAAVEDVVRKAEIAADGEDPAGLHAALTQLEDIALSRVRLLTPEALNEQEEHDLDAFLRRGVHRELAEAFRGRSDGDPSAVADSLHGLCGVLAAGRAPSEAPYTGIAVFDGLEGGSDTVGEAAQAAADALADAVAPPAGEYAAGEGEWWTGGAAARRAHDERLAMDVWNADKATQAAIVEQAAASAESVYPLSVYLPILALHEDVLEKAEAVTPGEGPLPTPTPRLRPAAAPRPSPGRSCRPTTPSFARTSPWPRRARAPRPAPRPRLPARPATARQGLYGRAEGEAGGEEPLVLGALERFDAVTKAIKEGGDCALRMTEFADWLRSDAPEGRGAFRPAAPEGAAADGAPEAGTAASVGAGLLAAYDAQILKDLELWRAEAYDGFPMHLARDIAGLASSIKVRRPARPRPLPSAPRALCERGAGGGGRGRPEHRDPHEFLRDYLRYVLQPARRPAPRARPGGPADRPQAYQSALAKAAGGRCARPARQAAELAAIHRIAEALAGHNSADPDTEDARGARPCASGPRRAARAGRSGDGAAAGGAGARGRCWRRWRRWRTRWTRRRTCPAATSAAWTSASRRARPPPARSLGAARPTRGAQAVDEAIEEAKEGVGPAMDAAMAELAAAAQARAEAALGRELAPGERPGMLLAAIVEAFDNPVSPVHRIVLSNEGGEEADAATRLEELRNKIPLVLQAAEGDEDSALRLMLFLAVHRLPEGAFGAVGPGWSREASFWTNASGKAGEMETKESLEGAAVALGADEVGEDELLGGLEPSGEDQLGGGGLEGTPLTGSGMPLGLL